METANKLIDGFVNCPFSSIVIALIMIGVITGVVWILCEDDKKD